MAIKIKEISASTTKWSENAGRAAAEFATNAEAAAEAWASNTGRAADTFHQAITAPNMKERFRRGVARAGFSTIAALTLSPRKPRGDPANYNRVQEIGKALNAKRLALLGGGGG
ncbi:hypothetical protein ES708_09881 [subsurface metagenome]